MTSQSTQPPTAGFWKIRHLLVAVVVVVVLVTLMLRACGSDEAEEQVTEQEKLPRQAIVVQIPASQWPPVQQAPVQPAAPSQPGYGYMPQQPVQQPQVPVADDSNPWAVQAPQSYQYRQPGAQWGRSHQPKPETQYAAPPSGTRFRPLEEDHSTRATPRPVVPQVPVQGYRSPAPYDRPAGSSFGDSAQSYPYPYSGGYPGGYYGQGAYGSPYAPVYPGVVPGAGWPGVW